MSFFSLKHYKQHDINGICKAQKDRENNSIAKIGRKFNKDSMKVQTPEKVESLNWNTSQLLEKKTKKS